MRGNPRADWTINDIKRVCNQIGLTCASPTRGSHYVVSGPLCEGALTIPFRRPIKPIYIKNFVNLAEMHIQKASETENAQNGKEGR
ncbi:MAG: hypothetical protein B7X99_16100 [Rhizobiales bacterium 17-65-6]|nr:MAG: hypothetical protein B7Z30_16710 [Rhizobiales bacterium 12-68-15]OYZ91923.1 MAG: hypothetical protein B7X99_16100 [Rhizobiales bacterium 17-65-6]